MTFDSMDIIKAMQIIAESNNDKLRLDKTIIARIISVENIETGEYRVAYEGNIFSAYSYDVTVSFAVDDNVYVKIPENDMSNRKIIEGRVSSSGNTLSDIIEQQVEINTIEPSLDKFYGYEANETYGLVAGVSSDHPYFVQTIYENKGSTIGDHMFQSYVANYGKIKITGSFYTKFVGVHHKGNYGLIVTFRTLQFNDDGSESQGTVSYRLDFSNFVGDPYRYTSPSPQSIIIDVFKDTVIGLDSILFFQENFETDKAVNYDNQVIYNNIGEDDPPICNIFVQDIDLSFCEVIDLKDTSYYLTIASPQGIVFSGYTTSLTLDARLKYKGENILSERTCKAYWYKENLSIKKGDENYDKLAGVRWEKLNSSGTDFLSSITVASNDVKTHARYKVVVIYQEDVTLSKEIEVKQLDAEYDLSIKQTTNSNSRILLQVVSNIKDDNRSYTADWYFFLPDGSYDLIANGENKSEIDVTDYLIYPTATFYCQTYYQNKLISIEVHNFSISESAEDLSLTYVGQDIFQYDANGDIAYEDTETDRTLGVKIEWKDGFGSAYGISYLAADGTEISNDRTRAYSPANSMMENLWVDSTSILHYNIRQKYNLNYNNNVVVIKIKCITNGNEYLFRKEILFLKDGDQGTNGTTYICAIRPVNLTTGDKLSGFHGLEYNGGWRGDGLNLRCYVYKNGDLVNGSPNFELKFSWECGSKDGKVDKLSINTIPGFTNLDDYRRIQGVGALDTKGDYVIKMTITVREKSNSERTEIHCQYPVDIAVGGFNMGNLDMNLPSYVKYTASGINASFLNQELKCYYSGKPLPIYSTDETILQVINSKLNPAQKFQYTGGIAALRCEASTTMYLLHPIMMYLDTYGNEAINGWDGTKLELNNEGGYILAPQIGAGEKETDNTFTGVVMGKDTAQDKVGLYGYKHGIAQFGFKEDGTAFIGPSGSGQILFDGNKGTITSGNFVDSASGTRIDLDDGKIDSWNFRLRTSSIDLDSANNRFTFKVDPNNNSSYFRISSTTGTILFNAAAGTNNYYLQSINYVAGTSADMDGKGFGAGMKITLNTGTIDAYDFNLRSSCLTINSQYNRFSFDVSANNANGSFSLKAGNKTLMYVSSSSYYLQSANYNGLSGDDLTGVYINLQNGSFKVGGNAEFRGVIRASSGNIGGWTISSSGLSNGDIYLYSNGNARFGDNCYISNGILYAKNASIGGTITATAGKIGAWSITDNALSCGTTTLGTDGKITTYLLQAYGGYIGGWEITTTSLRSLNGNVELRSNHSQPIHTIYGDIGLVNGYNGNNITYNFGIDSRNGAGDQGIIIYAGSNIGLRGQHTYIDTEYLHCTQNSPEKQTGIYARFA